MRILGYIEDKSCKITIFHQGFKYLVKFEEGMYEQTYKFRESDHLKTIQDFEKLIDDHFYKQVMTRFDEMRSDCTQLMKRHFHSDDNENEEIII